MKKKILLFPFIVFSLILLIFFYLLIIERNPKEIPSMLSNQKAPSFEAESLFLNEKFISEEVFKNKIIIVNFFATWCKPCRDEHGYIKLLSKKNKIHIIGINYKDKNEKTVEWLKKLGNPYSRIAIDKKGNIAIDWGELFLGMSISMCIAYASIGFFMTVIQRIGFVPFFIYRVTLSVIIIWIFF